MITNAPIQQSTVRQKREDKNRAGRSSTGNSTDFVDARSQGAALRHLQLVADNSARVVRLQAHGDRAALSSNPHLNAAVQARFNQPTLQKLKGREALSDGQFAAQSHDAGAPVQPKIHGEMATDRPAQLTGKGIGIGAAIGGGIGALGFLAGPIVGGITTAAGLAIGGAIGGHVSKGPDDFAKFPPNKNIDPDVVGEEEGGIRVVDEEGARPDDVPLIPEYRIAMHRLHDVVLVLENADRSVEKNPSPDTAKLRKKMVEVQKRGKELAKHHKASMRLLTSDTSVDDLKEEYVDGMNLLTAELERHAVEGENVINKHNYLKQGASLKDAGTGLWRTKWLAVKNAVDTALTSLWSGWRGTLKTRAKGNVSGGMDPAAWGRQIDAEKWAIYYGGSLAKGYKGPPKQNTRFLESEFDVDANMDAPAVARYLITEKHNTVDRGQLSPKNAAETGVGDMDKAMDKEVKKELLKAGAAPNAEGVDKIVSEEFETRVNAPENLGGAATDEVQRSIDEQSVRDTLTGLRATDVEKLAEIHQALDADGLCENGSLVARVLTAEEIETVREAIEA